MIRKHIRQNQTGCLVLILVIAFFIILGIAVNVSSSLEDETANVFAKTPSWFYMLLLIFIFFALFTIRRKDL